MKVISFPLNHFLFPAFAYRLAPAPLGFNSKEFLSTPKSFVDRKHCTPSFRLLLLIEIFSLLVTGNGASKTGEKAKRDA